MREDAARGGGWGGDVRRLDPEAVRRFIKAHPGIFRDDPDVARAALEGRAAALGDNVLSYESMAIARLQKRVAELLTERAELMETIEANALAAESMRAAALAVLDASCFAAFVEAATEGFMTIFDLESVELCLERGLPALPGAGRLRWIEQGGAARLMGPSAHGSLLRPAQRSAMALHRPGAGHVLSEALVRLDFGPGRPGGLLLFGSADADRFGPHMAADLVAFLGGVVSRAAQRWFDAAESGR